MTSATLAMFLVFLYTCYESVVKLQKGDIAKTIGSTLRDINFPSVTVCNVVTIPGSNASFDDVLRAIPDRDSPIPSAKFLT